MKANRALEIARLYDKPTTTAPRQRESRFPVRGSHRAKLDRDPPYAGELASDFIAADPVLADAVGHESPSLVDKSLQGLAISLPDFDFVAVGTPQRQFGDLRTSMNDIAWLGAGPGRHQEECRQYAEERTPPSTRIFHVRRLIEAVPAGDRGRPMALFRRLSQ